MLGAFGMLWLLMKRRYVLFFAMLAWAVVCPVGAIAYAADEASGGGYLSGYSEVDPRPTAMSWWSTLAYRFLSGHFARVGSGQGGRILSHVPLGPNRSVCIVELGERVFMLGVTEHQITLLSEVTDKDEIERLKKSSENTSGLMNMNMNSTEAILSSQIGSLEALTKRIPSLFSNEGGRG